MPDPCQIEVDAYATSAGNYVDMGAEAAIQYAESMTATANCDAAWQAFLQDEWNLDYCRAMHGYGAKQDGKKDESPQLIAARVTIAKIKEARNALAQYHADRLNDSLIDIAGILTDDQRAKVKNALAILEKAMR